MNKNKRVAKHRQAQRSCCSCLPQCQKHRCSPLQLVVFMGRRDQIQVLTLPTKSSSQALTYDLTPESRECLNQCLISALPITTFMVQKLLFPIYSFNFNMFIQCMLIISVYHHLPSAIPGTPTLSSSQLRAFFFLITNSYSCVNTVLVTVLLL